MSFLNAGGAGSVPALSASGLGLGFGRELACVLAATGFDYPAMTHAADLYLASCHVAPLVNWGIAASDTYG
jgi:hypothetical protein